jgi:hypothetical protein
VYSFNVDPNQQFERSQKYGRPASGRDLRVEERFDLGAATGRLVYRGTRFPCQVLDISIGGCCIRSENPFVHGALAPVEVVLPIYGMILRMDGITQWVSNNRLMGIRFIHPSPRTKNQLAGLLTCLVDSSAAETVKQAVANLPQDRNTALVLDADAEENQKTAADETAEAHPAPVPSRPHFEAPVQLGQGVQTPEGDDWPAILRVLKDGSELHGTIVYLSMVGCSVRMEHSYAGGLHLRVEVDFQMRGLPFRLGGVTQAIHDHRTVSVLFNPLSQRKQDELAQLIQELDEPGKS